MQTHIKYLPYSSKTMEGSQLFLNPLSHHIKVKKGAMAKAKLLPTYAQLPGHFNLALCENIINRTDHL